MSYPDAPQSGESFDTWIRPHLDELIDQSLVDVRAKIEAGELLSQQDQLHLIDQLIKDRKERAALIERAKGSVQ